MTEFPAIDIRPSIGALATWGVYTGTWAAAYVAYGPVVEDFDMSLNL